MGVQIKISHTQMVRAGWVMERVEGEWEEDWEGNMHPPLDETFFVKGNYRLSSYSCCEFVVDYRCNIDLLERAGLLDLKHKLV